MDFYKIDLVYLWVDSNDPAWQKEKNKFTGKKIKLDECGYRNNNELLYSLRSVAKYVNFINKIYIVTYKQIPNFLNLNHPKIKIIDHSQIMPKEAMPNYNSIAIELSIDNIPDLEEHYILMNDDFLFGNYITPEYFFDKDDKPIYIFKKSHFKSFIDRKDYVFRRTPGKLDKYFYMHNPTPYKKSLVKEVKNANKKAVDYTIRCHFRDGSSFHREKLQKILILDKKATLLTKKRYPVDWWVRLKSFFGIKTKIFHMETHAHSFIKNIIVLKEIEKFKPYTFAIEDNEKLTQAEFDLFQDFFKKMFPEKCEFEK